MWNCVPMEEEEILLAKHDERGVAQLYNFAQKENPAPKCCRSVVLRPRCRK